MAINAGTILAYLDLDTSKFGSALQLAQQQVSDFSGSGEGLSGVLDGVGAGMTTVGRALSVSISAPVVGAGVAITKWAGDFQDSANKVATIADTTVMSMDALKSGVLTISNNTGIAATDINEALYQTISATNDTANALGYTEIAAKAAKAGFTDTSTAIDGLSTVMNAYGLKGVEAMQGVSDQMLIAQNYGKTTFGELASSIGNVIPLAAQLNVGTEELFASIATLTKQGIGTSEAVTGIKAALSGVIKPTDEAAKMAASLGLEFNAAALESKGLGGFLADVKEKTGGNSEVMAQLFGSVEALNTIMALTSDQGMKDFAGGMDAMADSAGATDKAYATMMEGLNAGTAKLANSFMNFGVSLGNIIMPYAEKMVAWLQQGVEWMNGLNDGVKKFVVAGAGIAAALGPALTIGGKLLSAFSPVIPVLAAVGGAFALVYSRSERLQAMTAKLKTDGVAAFGNLKNSLQTYQAQVASGTAWTDALAKSINIAFGNSTGEKINTVTSRLIGGLQTTGAIMRGTYNGVGEFIASLIDGQGAATSLEEGLQAAFGGNVPDRVRELQASMAQFMTDIRTDFAEGGILGVMRGLGSRIGNALQDGWDAAKAGAATVRDHIADGLAIAKDWLAPKVALWMANLGEALRDAKQYAIDQLPAVREALTDGVSLAKDKLESGAKTAMKWLGDAYRSGIVQRGLGTLTKVGSTILDKLSASKTTIVDKAGELLKGLGTALGSDEAKNKLGDLADIAATIATKIASGTGGWKLTAGKLISDLVVQLTDNGFLSSALDGVGKIVTGIADGLGAAAGNIATAAESIIKALVESITKGGFIENAFTSAGELITKIAGVIGNAAPGIISAATTIGTALINGLAGLDWGTIFTSAGTVITSIGTVLSNVAIKVDGAAADIGIALINGIAGLDWRTIFTSAATVITSIGTVLANNATEIAGAALDLGKALLTGLAAVDWAGVSSSLATACGKLVAAIVEWFTDPDNLNSLTKAGNSIALGIINGVTNAYDNSMGGNTIPISVDDFVTLTRDQAKTEGLTKEWTADVANQLTTSFGGLVEPTQAQLATAVGLMFGGAGNEIANASIDLYNKANNAFQSLSDGNITDGFSKIGYQITDDLASAIKNGEISVEAALLALSTGMSETMLLTMDRSQISTYLTNYFAETSTDVTSLLKTNASDWGKIFGMAIPEGAKTGLDNGMFQLRSATGQVIAEVSAVNAKATVETGNKDTAQAGIDAASQTLDDGKTTVGTSAQGVADAIGTPFENLPEDQKVQAAVMMEGINSAITAGTPAATTAIETAANAVTDKAAEILNSAKGSTIGQDFVGGITTGVQNKQSALRTGLQTAASSGVGATSTAMSSSTGYGIGQNMVQGIINGVGSMAGSLATKMRTLAAQAVSAFRGALDMHSPSVVLMADGALMARSIGLGVTRGSEDAVRSMVTLARDMQDAWPDVTIDPQKVTGNPHSSGGWGSDDGGNVFQFYGDITVREEADIQKVSAALAEEFRDQLRGNGG